MSERKENLIRLPEVIKRMGFSKTTISELVNEKRFPSEIKVFRGILHSLKVKSMSDVLT